MDNKQLKTTLGILYEYAGEIEKRGGYKRVGGNSLKEYLRFEMLKYLLWLSDGGRINISEAEFMNDVFGFRYTQVEYENFYSTLKLSTSFASKVPEVFGIFSEYDDSESDSQNAGLASLLADFYRLIGIYFVSADNHAPESQVYRLTDFILFLRSHISGGYAGQTAEQNEQIQAAEQSRPLADIMTELDMLVGLKDVKKDVNSLVNLVKIRNLRAERGFQQADMSLHMVFSGNPGTGKTTVARLLAEIYRSIGLLSKGHLYETDRSGLVAAYVGQTALKVKEAVKKAMGGILFIDEAYALTEKRGSSDFGYEAVDTLLKEMEDNRGDLIVIAAGYTQLMEGFLSSNPGLRSRFNKFIHFPDYTAEELAAILDLHCKKCYLKMTKKAKKTAEEFFIQRIAAKRENFANGRDVRNYFEKAVSNQADRIAHLSEVNDEELNTIIYADVKDIVL